ncbi:MAG: hypothetical protein J2P57_16455 [Acidimicrobiaceae bacterium]|nr:hypothetical protein [Acidimicrobiaceae bacterium]
MAVSDLPRREAIRSGPRLPAGRPTPGRSDLYGRGGYSRVLLGSLMRAQLGVTVSVLLPAVAVVALYPMLCVLVPGVATAELGPIPVSLLVLGGGIYPPLVLLGLWYVRRARQAEQRFIELFHDR